jgi:hypothetical protein
VATVTSAPLTVTELTEAAGASAAMTSSTTCRAAALSIEIPRPALKAVASICYAASTAAAASLPEAQLPLPVVWAREADHLEARRSA